MKTKTLKGITASIGSAKGIIVYMRNVGDTLKVSSNSIIVTDKITAEYSEAFMKCAAVVACKGGITCHAAILCREHKKPCITSCLEAFKQLKEGDHVELNADTKTVSYL